MKDYHAMQDSLPDTSQPDTGANNGLLGRLGSLSTRLAVSEDEVVQAQRIRHLVFCEELGANSTVHHNTLQLEVDEHDSNCDHLLILDDTKEYASKIVGTQRFFLGGRGHASKNFYSQSEFDVEVLVSRYPDKVFMELGRSCVLPHYRSKRTMELMWQGTWAYAVENDVDIMIGCASFHAKCVSEIEEELKFLIDIAGVEPQWNVAATAHNAVLITNSGPPSDRSVLRRLPPLVKGYLRLGAMFSRQAVPDHEFGTIDVLVVLPVDRISRRYLKYYGEDASKHRA